MAEQLVPGTGYGWKNLRSWTLLRSLGEAAVSNHYVKPRFVSDKKGTIEIIKGRHPVVERMMKGEAFIPNDTLLDNREDRIAIITGPNMAGKPPI